MTPEISLEIVRTVTFSAAHRYASSALSREENQRVYGSLYRDEGFGHNFLVEAQFSGPVDPMTGMIANLVDIDAWLGQVSARFDHKFLNELPEFSDRVPTLERVAQTFYDLLVPLVTPSIQLDRVRIYEGKQTWVDYFGF